MQRPALHFAGLLLFCCLWSFAASAESSAATEVAPPKAPRLLVELKAVVGLGSFASNPAPLVPLQPLGTEVSTSQVPGRTSATMGLGVDVLAQFASWSVGLTAAATTALWDGSGLMVGATGGPAWSNDKVRLQLLAEIGVDTIWGAGGTTSANGADAVTWLPQAGGAANCAIVVSPGSAVVFEVWGRADFWRHDQVFEQTSAPVVGLSRVDTVTIAVGGFVVGGSVGYALLF